LYAQRWLKYNSEVTCLAPNLEKAMEILRK